MGEYKVVIEVLLYLEYRCPFSPTYNNKWASLFSFVTHTRIGALSPTHLSIYTIWIYTRKARRKDSHAQKHTPPTTEIFCIQWSESDLGHLSIHNVISLFCVLCVFLVVSFSIVLFCLTNVYNKSPLKHIIHVILLMTSVRCLYALFAFYLAHVRYNIDTIRRKSINPSWFCTTKFNSITL